MTDAAWDYPLPLGRRLCWYDGEHNIVIPAVTVESIWTDGRDLANGWTAVLPTENGATVTVTYDPGLSGMESATTQWLYVCHPQFGTLVDANVHDGRIVYDPDCAGVDCIDCQHGVGQWWEYVTSAAQVLANLAALGSLPIKLTERTSP